MRTATTRVICWLRDSEDMPGITSGVGLRRRVHAASARSGRARPPAGLRDAIYDLAMLEWLGRAGARRRYVILGVWAVVAVAGGVFGVGVFDRTVTTEGARGES